MYIYGRYMGEDFKINPNSDLKLSTDSEELSPFRDTWDFRTNYICTRFSGNRNDPLSNVEWYKNYLKLQVYLVNEGPKDKVAGFYKNQAYIMLNLGFVPIGYSPSFSQEMTVAIVRLLEQKKIKYVKTFATSFLTPFYKCTGSKDIWVSKIDGAEILGCSPENVTSLNLFERIIS